MDRTNIGKSKKLKYIFLISATIPLHLSLGFAFSRMYTFLALACLSIFVVVGISPTCRKSQSLWIFVLVAVDGIPANIFLIYNFVYLGIMGDFNFLFKMLGCVATFCIMLSIEEIVLGFIARLIWPKQYKLSLDKL